MRKLYCGMVCLLVASLLSPCYASVPVRVAISGHSLWSGHYEDGTNIANIKISSNDAHTWFHVWLEGSQAGAVPGQYILSGANDVAHVVRVRLSGKDWNPDMNTGTGMINHSPEMTGVLQLVIDGDQIVLPDIYTIKVKSTQGTD